MPTLLQTKQESRTFEDVKKIGVISDTHIPTRGKSIPEKVFEVFNGIDLILHVGDIETLDVLNELENISKVIAVYGNMDSDFVRSKLKEREIIKIDNFKIGLMHGYGAPDGLPERVKSNFNEKLDCIVFGHSHRAFNEIKDKILFFNPGSPTDTVFASFNSVGLLKINDKIKGEIIKL